MFGHQAPLTRLYEAARAACLTLVAFVERAVVRYPGQIQIMDFEGFSEIISQIQIMDLACDGGNPDPVCDQADGSHGSELTSGSHASDV